MFLRTTPELSLAFECTHITTKAQFNQKQPLITVHQAMAKATAPGQYASVPG